MDRLHLLVDKLDAGSNARLAAGEVLELPQQSVRLPHALLDESHAHLVRCVHPRLACTDLAC